MATMSMDGREFTLIGSLALVRDGAGNIVESSPQVNYANRNLLSLHKHGAGSFCQFRIAVPKGLIGVYALVVGGSVCYIGECVDLGKRFNMGYGNISPRNCYRGGQPTNCKINHRVLEVGRAGQRVDLYFYPSAQRKAVEQLLVAQVAPPWND